MSFQFRPGAAPRPPAPPYSREISFIIDSMSALSFTRLIATGVPLSLWMARHTVPNEPWPILSVSWNWSCGATPSLTVTDMAPAFLLV